MNELKRIDVISAGKILGLVYGFLAILFTPFILIALITGSFSQSGGEAAFTGIVAIMIGVALPFIYGAIAFLLGCIGALIYNFIAGRFGGLKFQLRSPYVSPTLPLSSP